MAEVILKNIFKSFDAEKPVVDNLSLAIRDKEFVVLVGPSGCGKSTTLRMIAGLENITSGEICIGTQRVNDVHPKDRDIAMVFQNYALYPHMTVFDNMAFGLKLKKVAKKTIHSMVMKAAEIVDLIPYLDRKPKALSGGQRQRVALGRAIVRNPKVFLFDEPLSNLDAKLRGQMRVEIARLQAKLGTTTIYVTHDQTEAMTMADRIAILKDGVLQQYDTPLETYNHPANQFVAGFIGSPAMNFIPVEVTEKNTIRDNSGSLILRHDLTQLSADIGRRMIMGVRSEDILLMEKGAVDPSVPQVEILHIEPLGNESFIHAKIGPHPVTIRIHPEIQISKMDKVAIRFNHHKLHFFDPDTGSVVQ